MDSSSHQQNAFPAAPPPHSAGGHEMRDYYDDPSAPRPSPNQTPYLTPYLGLRARLSQVWINRWTVLLLLVLVRVLFAIASTNNGLTAARADALSACTDVENIGSTLASMPHYMSQGVNDMTSRGVEMAVDGLMNMVNLSVTGVEEIVMFVIGMMTNTYLCLITLAVSGSLSAAVDLLSNAQDDLNGALGSISDDISTTAEGLQTAIQSITNQVNTFFGGSPPVVNFTKQIDELKNLKLPANLTDDLQKLNSSIPTFADVKNITDTLIQLPFEELKKVIADAYGNYTFNSSLLPVPQKEALTFCSQNNGINDFFDGLVKLVHILRNVFLGVLLTLAILACIPMAWWEIRRYNRLQTRAKNVQKYATDPMDAVYISSRPYTSDIGRALASRFNSPRRQIIVRWTVAYFTSVPALFILSLAVAGLFSCLCQYIVLRTIEKEVPALTQEVANFTDKVVTSLNNASTSWANGVNNLITKENTMINNDLLSWVNTSTTAVNATLNKFITETTSVLNATFGGTVLYQPIQGVFDCLVGLKVDSFQQGLTWVQDHAHVNFPLLNNDTFSLGAVAKLSNDKGASELLSDPSGTTTDEISAAILKVTSFLEGGIRQEAIISTMILVAWLLLFFGSIGYSMWKLQKADDLRGMAGNEYNNMPPYRTSQVSYGQTSQVPQTTQASYATRPMSPAPAYTTDKVDLNTSAPYTLNIHPMPRHSVQTVMGKDGITTQAVAWPFSQRRNPEPISTYEDEKAGFI
jgi:methyl-accepting chemotaxis protein